MSSSGRVIEALTILYKVQQTKVTDLYTFFIGDKYIVCIQTAMNTVLKSKPQETYCLTTNS